MSQYVTDLRAEARDLAAVLAPRPDADYTRETLFKGYTIDDVLRHLHQGDQMAWLSATDPDAFRTWAAARRERRAAGVSTRDDARLAYGHLAGRALLQAWQVKLAALCDKLAALDPEARLVWSGPDMGVRMFTTARQMEVWSHGQEIHDVLGLDRAPTDRLKSIAHIGVRTFGWTFANRGQPAPSPAPHVCLTAPSGATWQWNPPQADNHVTGSALDFCQVVTQVRNIADTSLTVVGAPARAWMAIAQCFAGPPETPPAPGSRHKAL